MKNEDDDDEPRAAGSSMGDVNSMGEDGHDEEDDDTSDFDDHISAFTGSGFNAAQWSNDDLPPPTAPIYGAFGDEAEEAEQDEEEDVLDPPRAASAPVPAQGSDDASGEAGHASSDEWEPNVDDYSPSAEDDEEFGGEALPSWGAIESEPALAAVELRSSAQIVPPASALEGSMAEAFAGFEQAGDAQQARDARQGNQQQTGFGGQRNGRGKKGKALSLRERGHQAGGRVTPHDLQAEKCVLGALLLTPDRLVEVTEICKPPDFYDRRNRTIFECMIQLDERGQVVDGVHLIATLRAMNTLGEIGGVTYLAEITSSVSTSAHVKHHAALISETAKLRGLIEASNGIIERAFETAPDADEVQELIDESEAAIFAIASQGEARGATGVSSILDEVFHSIEAQRDRGEFTGIPSGFYELDDMLGGFNPGEMTVIAARPAMGKTAFVLNIMDHAATHQADCLGYAPSVLFFSLEMGRASIVQRMLVARAGVEAHRLRSGHLHDREYADLVEAAGVLKNARLFIDDTPGLSIMALRSRARRLKAEHGLDMIVIDYLQLLSAKAESRQQEISVISRSLKEISRELEVPLLTLAQLSRSVESRENKRPQLSDLRESGSIEQDADVVMMLFREEYYAPTDENKGKAEAIIVKHRNGATGDVSLQFQGAMLRFSNREASMAEPITGL
ncbi:Replicative DNA helicase [Planctomycetes bacterium Poly30]|uniref:Replicative DNA helicase n=1 Tax=Saltatorellus ferox TaxID=2528018 RepID=A0A518ERA3_9BACT|nr:Replicative DNA helicase [Planctomycetes bacterium Poly30]